MKKFVRDGIKRAGLRVADVLQDQKGKHPFLILPNGQRVTFAASPKCPHHTALNIARDIIEAMQ